MADPTRHKRRVMPQVMICPECVQGKHPNCTEETLDLDLDEFVPCGCSHG